MAAGSEKGGCLNCYAARQALRHRGKGGAYEGLVRLTDNGPRWTGKVQMVWDNLEEPMHWRAPRMIFVDSMSDLYHESLSFEEIALVHAAMLAAPRHTYQILTKRAARRLEFYTWLGKVAANHAAVPSGIFTPRMLLNFMWLNNGGPCALDSKLELPVPFIWEGVSIEDQPTADARIPLLLQTPAAVRFISYEPALGPVDIYQYLGGARNPIGPAYGGRGLDWVICGGESGAGARPFDIAWARSVKDQCAAAGVAFFMKQLGANLGAMHLHSKKGGDMEEWPEDLRIRQFPEVRR
jgi:protein gp37